jgi:hypothetical protein
LCCDISFAARPFQAGNKTADAHGTNHYQSQDYGVGYATANALTDSWKKAPENPILHQPNATLTGTGAVFKDNDGNLRYVFHAHYDRATIHPRKMYITALTIDDNGKLKMEENNIICPVEYK